MAKAGAMLDEGFVAEAGAETMKKEREGSFAVCGQLPLPGRTMERLPKPKEKWVFVENKSENMKHRTEWCAEADRYRCMRCGRGCKYMKMPGKCTGPIILTKSLAKWEDDIWEAMIWSEEWTGREKCWHGAESVRDTRGKNGTKTNELRQT